MGNFFSGTASGSAPTQVDVDSTEKEVVAENYSRSGLVLTNLSAGTMYLGINNTALLGSGISLVGNGGVWVMDEFTYTKESIHAIAHSDNSLLAIQEFVVRS